MLLFTIKTVDCESQLVQIHESQFLNFQEFHEPVDVMLKFAIVEIFITQKSANTTNLGFFFYQRASTPLNENLLKTSPLYLRNQKVGKKLWTCFWVHRKCVHRTPCTKLEIEWQVRRAVFETLQKKENSKSHSDCL